MPSFHDRVAIVTGAASGIGLAIAQRLARDGARVVLADLDGARVTAAAAAIGPTAWGTACDVSDEAAVAATCDATVARWGRIDIIINNAGVMVFKRLEDHAVDDWLRVLRIDLLGAFFFIREAFRRMRDGGAIVNVSSIHAVETTPLVCSYAAAKAALLSLTRSAALEGKARHIRVNAVLPGAIDTPMLRENPNIKSGLETISTSDVGTPDQVATVVAFLASDEAAFIQGAGVSVDGGRLSRL